MEAAAYKYHIRPANRSLLFRYHYYLQQSKPFNIQVHNKIFKKQLKFATKLVKQITCENFDSNNKTHNLTITYKRVIA